MGNIQVAAIFIVLCEIHSKSHSEYVEPPVWIHKPCDEDGNFTYYAAYGFEDMAQRELIYFLEFIEETYRRISMGMDFGKVSLDDSCPNITKALSHLRNNTKIRVFYSNILRWAMFLQEIMVNIQEPDRRETYQAILIHLKRLACEFRAILCHPRKKRPFNWFKACLRNNFSQTESQMFDLLIVKKLQLFFSESEVILGRQLNETCNNGVRIYYQ